MDGNDKLYLRYKSVSIFGDAAEKLRPLAELISARDAARRLDSAAAVFRAVMQSNSSSTGEWMQKLLLLDDNPFSRAAAMGERINERLKKQVLSELNTFKQLSAVKPSDFATDDTTEFFPQFGFGGFSVTYDGLLRAYAANGCGIFSGDDSFVYRDGGFAAGAMKSFARLSDLKGYPEEKYEVVKNMQDFSESHPAFHTLLYGDRGTGKSTTVRAAANEFRGAVKLIDTDGDLSVLPEIVKHIRGLKQKFIIFADGLSVREFERCQSGIEGLLDSTPTNWLLYCTVDRERGSQEGAPEELAMFDRFGLVVTYLNPDREAFCDILKQILRSRGIKWRDEYGSVAELAARKKGGRSPRAAKQIADLIESTYALKRCGNG